MRDLVNNVEPVVSIVNAVKTAAANGTGVDLAGFESAMAVVNVGAEGDTLAAGLNFQISLEHSDDDSTYTDCVQADIVDGTMAADGVWLILDGTAGGNPDTTGSIHQVGYVGGKRYVRLVIAKTGTHTNGTPIGGVILRGNPRHTADISATIHNV